MTTPNTPSRRRFLLSTSTAALATTALGTNLPGCGGTGGNNDGGMSAACNPSTGICDTGLTVADLAVGQFRSFDNDGYIIGRDAMGFYAFSNICTHMGCVLPAPNSAGTIRCPCHMSNYDANGHLTLAAPGSTNQVDLNHYAVTFTGTGATARIQVNTMMVVTDRTARMPAP